MLYVCVFSGGSCKDGGLCTVANTECTTSTQCGGGFCVPDQNNELRCCDDPCTGDCQHCVEGSTFFVLFRFVFFLRS